MVEEVEVTVEGTPVGDLSPHGQLLAAFEALKIEKAALQKDKDSLIALTALQKSEKEELVRELEVAKVAQVGGVGELAEELENTKQSLEEEAAAVKALKAQLEFKAVSAECQIAEVENFSKESLAEAIEKNAKYSAKIADLKNSLAKAKTEKEQLLNRTATLARRDQLQKANIAALTGEIDALTVKIIEFEQQFSILATRSAEMTTIHKNESVESLEGLSGSEEKRHLKEQITSLEALCEKMKQTEGIMKDTFVETLTKHRDGWLKEKNHLKKQVKELVSEKESIEGQVKEIAELLERDILERTGRAHSESAEENIREPPGRKKNMAYNQ